jgi:hypothetical protein
VRFFCPVLEVYVGRQVALGALAQLSVDTQWCRLRIRSYWQSGKGMQSWGG